MGEWGRSLGSKVAAEVGIPGSKVAVEEGSPGSKVEAEEVSRHIQEYEEEGLGEKVKVGKGEGKGEICIQEDWVALVEVRVEWADKVCGGVKGHEEGEEGAEKEKEEGD